MPNALLLHPCRKGRLARYADRISRRLDGFQKERRVVAAFETRPHPQIPDWLGHLERASKRFDRIGVDVIAQINTGFKEPSKVYLQVKSSEYAAHDFEQSHPQYLIYVIIIDAKDTPDIIRSKVIEACRGERERQLQIPVCS